jgi:hypothetical protein
MSANLLPTYRGLKPLKPMQPLKPGSKPAEMFPGQRTMPVPGAPLLPKNPLLDLMKLMQSYRK